MLVSKYADGLPLHRQRDRYKRLGFDIPVATLVDQVRWSTDLLRPLWRAAVAECIASKVMHSTRPACRCSTVQLRVASASARSGLRR